LTSRYLTGPLRTFCNDQIEFAMMRDSVGYVRILSFAQYAKSPRFADQLAALETALDSIFVSASSWRALVLDVRLNGGGSDVFGTTIAARLTGAPYLAYNKVIRNDVARADARSTPQPAMVNPSPRAGFKGAVFLLTGTESVSAAETFAMALMHRQPQVLRVGEATQGVFSDVLIRALPNGWRFGLPNEIYLTNDGKSFDGPGVPPDIQVPVFARRDLAAGRDAALDRVLAIVRDSSASGKQTAPVGAR
jgi:C-terminal processing protease CtpA/Prc